RFSVLADHLNWCATSRVLRPAFLRRSRNSAPSPRARAVAGLLGISTQSFPSVCLVSIDHPPRTLSPEWPNKTLRVFQKHETISDTRDVFQDWPERCDSTGANIGLGAPDRKIFGRNKPD